MILALSGFGLILVSIIAFVLILSIIIALHEFGHLIIAKKSGILCYEYSIGMGPIIYKRMFGETRFCIRAIPIGGFVSMASCQYFDDDIKKEETIGILLNEDNKIKQVILDPNVDSDFRGKVIDLDLVGESGLDRFITFESGNNDTNYFVVADECEFLFEKGQRLPMSPYEKTFDSKKKTYRFLTLVAGPLMNFILAMFIYFIVSFSIGVPNKSSNKIGSITNDYPVDVIESITDIDGNKYRINKNDRITAVFDYESNDFKTCKSWSDFSNLLDSQYDNYHTTIRLKTNKIEGKKDSSNNDLYFEIETITLLNSIGISNDGIPYEYLSLHEIPNTEGVMGVMLGSHFSGWKNDISTNDFITKIKIKDEIYDISGETIDGITYNGWSLLSYLMDNNVGKGEPKIYLEYYKLVDDKNTGDILDNEYKLVSLEDSIKSKDNYKPYTDEVLKSQNIEKIQHFVGVGATTHKSIDCIPQSFKMFWSDFTMIFRTLKLLLFPSDVRQIDASNLSGVVGIFGMVKSYVNSGFVPLLAFMAMLSVNIGIVNLLPIPALDGGRILFIIIEAITKKRVPKKVEGIINMVFMGLLFLLILYVTFNDVMRLI